MERRTLLLAAAAFFAAALAAGCTGTLIDDGPSGLTSRDSGTDRGRDAGPPLLGQDAGEPSPGEDGGPAPSSDGGADAGVATSDDGGPSLPPPQDAGPEPTPDSGPPDPCAGVSCPANAHCDPALAACRCDEGFVDMGGSCEAPPAGDPAARTQAEVCDAWRDGHVENASPAWMEGPTACDVGTLHPEAIGDTLRRVNLFRWLAGLPPVSHDDSNHQQMMECALMMSANGSLSHDPPSSWTCYTEGGASAAGRSNIALGYGSPGAAINGYMGDRNTPSLGHRRWILGVRLGQVEIGFAGRGQCLGVFGGGGSSDRPWTAYPNPGFAPYAMIQDPYSRNPITWSFQANSISLRSEADAAVVRVSDGMNMPVESYLTGGYGPPPTLGFTPMGWEPAAGESYRVTISGTSEGDITYEVTLVGC